MQICPFIFHLKIKSMKNVLLASVLLVFAACQSDATREKAFSGRYQVTLHLAEKNKDFEKAKKQVDEEITKAQKEMESGIKDAKKEIKEEMGDENHFGDAVGNFVEGMGSLAQGLAGLGKSLGKMGIDLGQGILDGLKFKADFRDDGNVYFGKGSKIQVGSGEGNFWEIRDGKMYLWSQEDEKTAFEMKDLGEGKWDLVSDEIVFHLEKIREEQ